MACPTTLVWFHRTGDWRGLIDSSRVAVAMGLLGEDAVTLARAEDLAVSPSADPDAYVWRAGMTAVLAALVGAKPGG